MHYSIKYKVHTGTQDIHKPSEEGATFKYNLKLFLNIFHVQDLLFISK